MRDSEKTREQLLAELSEARDRVADLERTTAASHRETLPHRQPARAGSHRDDIYRDLAEKMSDVPYSMTAEAERSVFDQT